MNIIKSPLVSIIIPLFNCELYVEETLQSLINQSYTNWESIIVDDGSIDSSISIVRKKQKQDNRIFFHKRENLPKGGSVCRNIGIKKAKGKYVIFLDSDDLLSSTCLENRVKLIEQNLDLDFAVFPMQQFTTSTTEGQLTSRLNVKNHLAHFIATDCIWQITSPIWKKKILLKLGGFDERLPRLQDPNLHMRALLLDGIKYKVYPHERADCFYRVLPKKNNTNFNEIAFSAYCMHSKDIIARLEDFKKRSDYNKYIVPAFEWVILASFLYFWSSSNNINHKGKIILSKFTSIQPIKVWIKVYIKIIILMHKTRLNKFSLVNVIIHKIHLKILSKKLMNLG